MPEPIVKKPDLRKAEVFTLAGPLSTDAATGPDGSITRDPQSIDDIRWELSATNNLFPSLLDNRKEPPSEQAASALARDSTFDHRFKLSNSLGNIKVEQDSLQADLVLPQLVLSYDEGQIDLGFLPEKHFAGGSIESSLKYDYEEGQLLGGGLRYKSDGLSADMSISRGDSSFALGFRDPGEQCDYRLKVEESAGNITALTAEFSETDRYFRLRFSPQGEVLEMTGRFSAGNNWESELNSVISSAEIRNACGLSRKLPKGGEVSFGIEYIEDSNGEGSFSGQLKLNIFDLNIRERRKVY